MSSVHLSRDQTWTSAGWRAGAACASLDPAIFFPIGHTETAHEDVDTAKRVCNSCPSSASCLSFAIETNQEYGVWGGTTEDERRVLRRSWRKAKSEASTIYLDATSGDY
jgi:WhiB family redox-sensing transcriptional regulator